MSYQRFTSPTACSIGALIAAQAAASLPAIAVGLDSGGCAAPLNLSNKAILFGNAAGQMAADPLNFSYDPVTQRLSVGASASRISATEDNFLNNGTVFGTAIGHASPTAQLDILPSASFPNLPLRLRSLVSGPTDTNVLTVDASGFVHFRPYLSIPAASVMLDCGGNGVATDGFSVRANTASKWALVIENANATGRGLMVDAAGATSNDLKLLIGSGGSHRWGFTGTGNLVGGNVCDYSVNDISKLRSIGINNFSTHFAFNADSGSGLPIIAARNDGRVGIGTSSPSDKLDVNGGNIRLSSVNTALLGFTANTPPGTGGVALSYFSSAPGSGDAFRWSDGTLGNTLGFYISAGMVFQGNSANGDFKIAAPTGTAALGTVNFQVVGSSGFTGLGLAGTVPTYQLAINGSVGYRTTIQTANYVVAATDHSIYLENPLAANVTLPAPTLHPGTNIGRRLLIKRKTASVGAVQLVGNVESNPAGYSLAVLEGVQLEADGLTWNVV